MGMGKTTRTFAIVLMTLTGFLQPAIVGQAAPAQVTCDGKPATIVVTGGTSNVQGSPFDDVIVTTNGPDFVHARGGDDTVCVRNGADEVRGGRGADRIFGGRGRDELIGGRGKDFADGRGGEDRCRTETRRDCES